MDTFYGKTAQHVADAPEAVDQHSDLILAEPSQDTQLPEALLPHQGSCAKSTRAECTSMALSESNEPLADEKHFMPTDDTGMGRKPRQRWIWVLIAIVILLLAIGLGVGLGFGLSSNAHASNPPNAAASNSSGTLTSPLATITSSIPSTTSTSPVTSGTTGMAQYACTLNSTVRSTAGTEYMEDCNVNYQDNSLSYYNANVRIQSMRSRIIYSLDDCLNECDIWNTGAGVPECRAVSYHANLTDQFEVNGRQTNCFLKNDRAVGQRTGRGDWAHIMSAWMGCLNVTCSGA